MALVEAKISEGKYIFTHHAQMRVVERAVSDLDVINILSGKKGYSRTRNKSKDKFESSFAISTEDWKYCFEGCDIDGNKIRIILTFTEDWMPIITVIRIK